MVFHHPVILIILAHFSISVLADNDSKKVPTETTNSTDSTSSSSVTTSDPEPYIKHPGLLIMTIVLFGACIACLIWCLHKIDLQTRQQNKQQPEATCVYKDVPYQDDSDLNAPKGLQFSCIPRKKNQSTPEQPKVVSEVPSCNPLGNTS